ncbi:MAG: hypothetical protein ACXIVO_13685 [Glycocaulis sp.]
MAVSLPEGLVLRALREGFAAQPKPLLVSEVDVGDARQRPLHTGKRESFSAVFRLKRSDYTTLFVPFWRDDLGRGALWFDWTHPLTGVAVEAQFAGATQPQAVPIAGGRVQLTCRLNIRF